MKTMFYKWILRTSWYIICKTPTTLCLLIKIKINRSQWIEWVQRTYSTCRRHHQHFSVRVSYFYCFIYPKAVVKMKATTRVQWLVKFFLLRYDYTQNNSHTYIYTIWILNVFMNKNGNNSFIFMIKFTYFGII